MTTSDAVGQQSARDRPITSAVPARMADPAAWAVTAFATTSFMLGMFQTGLLNNAGVLIVLPAAFFFGGLVQIIVAVLEISRGNLFGAAVFGTYGPFWVMFGAFETLYATSVPAAQLNSALSLFLAVFAVVISRSAIILCDLRRAGPAVNWCGRQDGRCHQGRRLGRPGLRGAGLVPRRRGRHRRHLRPQGPPSRAAAGQVAGPLNAGGIVAVAPAFSMSTPQLSDSPRALRRFPWRLVHQQTRAAPAAAPRGGAGATDCPGRPRYEPCPAHAGHAGARPSSGRRSSAVKGGDPSAQAPGPWQARTAI